jgi:hypothetical protein
MPRRAVWCAMACHRCRPLPFTYMNMWPLAQTQLMVCVRPSWQDLPPLPSPTHTLPESTHFSQKQCQVKPGAGPHAPGLSGGVVGPVAQPLSEATLHGAEARLYLTRCQTCRGGARARRQHTQTHSIHAPFAALPHPHLHVLVPVFAKPTPVHVDPIPPPRSRLSTRTSTLYTTLTLQCTQHVPHQRLCHPLEVCHHPCASPPPRPPPTTTTLTFHRTQHMSHQRLCHPLEAVHFQHQPPPCPMPYACT